MSFAEKIGSLMQRPNDDLVSKDEIPWWLKYSARGLGTFAGGMGLLFGILNLISDMLTFDGFSAIFGDIWLSLVAFSCLIFEAPCCCMFMDYVQESSNYVEKRPYWNRAAYYMIASAFTFLLRISITLLLAVALIFCTGLLYGMMALGKKASSEEMRTNASSIYSSNNQQFPPAATSNSNLVDGIQPAGLSNPFDSRV